MVADRFGAEVETFGDLGILVALYDGVQDLALSVQKLGVDVGRGGQAGQNASRPPGGDVNSTVPDPARPPGAGHEGEGVPRAHPDDPPRRLRPPVAPARRPDRPIPSPQLACPTRTLPPEGRTSARPRAP